MLLKLMSKDRVAAGSEEAPFLRKGDNRTHAYTHTHDFETHFLTHPDPNAPSAPSANVSAIVPVHFGECFAYITCTFSPSKVIHSENLQSNTHTPPPEPK